MTVVVGYKDNNGKVYMGSDLSTLYGLNRLEQTEPKFVSLGNKVLVGSCGLAMVHQYLVKLSCDKTPAQIEKLFDFSHIRGIIHFAEFIRDGLEEEGYIVVEEAGDPKVLQGSFIVATPTSLWLISPDFAVAEVKDFVSVGSGAEFAYGAFHTYYMEGLNCPAEQLINTAISAANNYNAGCSGFSDIVCVSDLKPLEGPNASGNSRQTGGGKRRAG